jgi:Acyltransferase family
VFAKKLFRFPGATGIQILKCRKELLTTTSKIVMNENNTKNRLSGKDLTFFNTAKGLAIVLIVYHHSVYDRLSYLMEIPFLKLFARIYPSVDVFIFLSGFGLALGCLRRETSGQKESWPLWYFRHFKQILIPYWGTLIIYNLLNYFILGNFYTLKQNIIHFTCLHGIWRDHIWVFTGALWYVSFIAVIYLLFPVFWKIYRSLDGYKYFVLMFTVHCLLIYASLTSFVESSHQGYSYLHPYFTFRVFTFALGLMLARPFIAHKDRVLGYIRNTGTIWIAILPLSAAYLMMRELGRFRQFEEFGGFGEIAMFLALLVTAIKIAESKGRRIFAFLLGIFGMFSYEIYLLHEGFMLKYDPGIFSDLRYDWMKIVIFLLFVLVLGIVYKIIHQTLADREFWRNPLAYRPKVFGEFKALLAVTLHHKDN